LCKFKIRKSFNDLGIDYKEDNAAAARAALKKYLEENPIGW
jgi:hypothetical protein